VTPANRDEANLATDRATVERMADGDTAALAVLYDRHARAVYSLAVRIVTDPGDAEDVVQEVFTQAWQQAGRYDAGRAPVAGWLMVMTRARALDRLRRRRARVTLVEMNPSTPDPRDPAVTQEALAITAEEAGRLHGALIGLSEGQRTAIELAYYEGLSQSDIAARLSEPLGTIKTRIRSGLLKLRAAMAGVGDTP
jgi:RNA polymerase sigma-70 factor (ECF subfamily)